ncbi:MAG: PrsW family intramembrane metalloprotease [Candidatus Dormibacteraeota bacterium]|nr:PrsW family intramembrane metalloprotease [Candidatus Dormibacteraeota bacterium]
MSVAVAAANPRRFRPRRYAAAAVIAGFVVVVILAGTVLSEVIRGVQVATLIFGLPAIACFVAGTVFEIRGLAEPPGVRRRDVVRGGILIGAGFVLWVLVAESAFLFTGDAPALVLLSAGACLPTTAFALWAVHRIDRHEKEPWRVVLVAAIWGAIVATTLALIGEVIWDLVVGSSIPPGSAANVSTGISAGFMEEIAKGVAVLLLYLVMRDEFDGLVDGIIYGAVVGLGFNFMESTIYMVSGFQQAAQMGGPGVAGAGVQWFVRQVVDLFTGHATYTALTGAGIGLARHYPRLWQKLPVIAAGWLSAIAGHLIFDAWVAVIPVQTILLALLREVAGGAPWTAIVLLLLGMGLIAEGNAIDLHLRTEAASGRGAILPQEVGVLRHPMARLRERMRAFVHRGPRGWIAVTRLRNAQLDLALEQWHRERQVIETPLAAEDLLRNRVIRLRGQVPPGALGTA